MLMEYADYGIYERSDSGILNVEKPKLKKTSNSEPLKQLQKHQLNLLKRVSGTQGALKQIYSDIKAVVKFIEDMGELLDQRVIM